MLCRLSNERHAEEASNTLSGSGPCSTTTVVEVPIDAGLLRLMYGVVTTCSESDGVSVVVRIHCGTFVKSNEVSGRCSMREFDEIMAARVVWSGMARFGIFVAEQRALSVAAPEQYCLRSCTTAFNRSMYASIREKASSSLTSEGRRSTAFVKATLAEYEVKYLLASSSSDISHSVSYLPSSVLLLPEPLFCPADKSVKYFTACVQLCAAKETCKRGDFRI